MITKIDRKELLAALITIKPGLATKEIVEQSSFIVFHDNHIHTYNDEIYISYPYNSNIEGAISGKELFQLLNRVKEDTLIFSISDLDLNIKGKRFKASISFQKEILLPYKEIETNNDWNILPSNFCESLKLCLFSISKNINKPILTCIHCHKDKMESCDDYRFTRKYFDKAYFEDLLILGKTANSLIEINPIEYNKVNGWVWFRNKKGVKLASRTYNMDYPELDKYIEVKGSKIKFPKETLDIIDKAVIFSKELDTGLSVIDLKVENSVLSIKSSNSSGNFSEEIKISHRGNSFQVSINPDFLKIILTKLSLICTVDNTKMRFDSDGVLHVVRVITKVKEEKVEIPF